LRSRFFMRVSQPTALVTGISGQDGTYLAELLLGKGYRVVGTSRNVVDARRRIAWLAERVELHSLSLNDAAGFEVVIQSTRPDEIYHLAGETHVSASWNDPVGTAIADGVSVARLLEAVCAHAPRARIFQPSTCEMFASDIRPLNEGSRFHATSPYSVAKLYAHWLITAYREARGIFGVSGILFNHESPRRDPSFVTRKISVAVARIASGQQRQLRLGNLDVRRDWGFAGDYVDAMWRALQLEAPDDYVIGTGEAKSVREFCERAFGLAGLDYREFVVVDPTLVRVGDAPVRVGDASRARARLGWAPSVSFDGLVRMMVEADLSAVS
jgi:GDPmannose 4,6-dehydratase